MDLIKLSLVRPVFAWVLMAGLIIFGAIAMNRLGTSQMPDVDFPVLDISFSYQGASPEVIESTIIDLAEQKLLGINGVKEMKSTARQGSGSIRLDFDLGRDLDVALQEVQSALGRVKWPLGVDPPTVAKTNPEEQPIMFVAVASDRPFREILVWCDQFLLDQLRFLSGIGEVSIGGFSERNVRIWPDIQKLKQADLTLADLIETLDSQHFESAAGTLLIDQKELRLRWQGEAMSVEGLKKLKILKRGGVIIPDSKYFIGDFAQVEDGLSDIRRMARMDGKNAVAIAIRKQRGGNEVQLAEKIHERLRQLESSSIPKDITVRATMDFTKSTKAVVDTTQNKLMIAALITIIVCILFLANWQSALNILFSIPTSILGTFIIIYFSGFTLNLFTLLALTLAVSIVVDDAIMLLENIMRHFHMGKSPFDAAYDGAKEVLPAASAATFAVVAIFIPVIFMSGITGKFFFQFGITMSAAVLLSLLEAITITPMRAAAFLGSQKVLNPIEKALERIAHKTAHVYRKILAIFLKVPKLTVVFCVAFFVISLYLIKEIKREFVPTQDQDIIILNGQTPPGSSLELTQRKAEEIEAAIKDHPFVSHYFISIGAGGPGAEINNFFMPVYLKSRELRQQSHQEIMDQLRGELKKIKGARVSLRDISARNLTSGKLFPVSFNIFGPDLELLKSKSDEIIKRLDGEGLTQELDTDFKMGTEELTIEPKREQLARFNISAIAVAKIINASLASLQVGKITLDGHRYDIRIKIKPEEITQVENIKNLLVRNNYGQLIKLGELVNISRSKTFQSIVRINRQRAIGVFGNLAKGASQANVLRRAKEIATEVLPEGYGFKLEGAAEGLDDSFRSLYIAMIIGLLMAYMILAVQFNSFIDPWVILFALPFSISGALLTLYFMHTSINLFSMIGIIVLMGICKKNSILLVEFTNQQLFNNKISFKEALLTACPIRLRPIIMTSVATVAAALPLVFGNSMGQELRTPLGLTIMGGTIVSTVFTLIGVPCLYLWMSSWFKRSKTA